MKTFLTGLTLALTLFCAPLQAAEMDHSQMQGGLDHKQMMQPAQLGENKKSEIFSHNKSFMLGLDQVPVTPGVARFQVALLGRDQRLIQDGELKSASFEMPGMTMELAPVAIKKVANGTFELVLQIPMAGLWKLHLLFSSGDISDEFVVKFVTK
ncbi:MAG: hypothetical protein A2600_10405 [Candidatus Lambdaproteobacteria bacterium RIFOXYD1_FULL_56_27]|uniref:YtkA-like domain-containing protein n=1 Tax=Candidatus Lambdaproteobacteria bacterium RIFOXYD2_FULL_56_26 TaxID=1817773 RepID=A0A1F6GQJ6_9PROT|nr:MAG: hypothetical protein A2557_09280 [Candidatus Lambdaproteobacteria bacterium RIFOXYD2_FULL_56_26]OGH04124.1 MAG: hypothetical protein A2426_02670 [Candidatus Lambdaproteobacteria bacterium RIFOXYC1_FULL_56_13]OGH06359.1 MAG: hypothetical protein A2600_10405 [Candidatus Lambdaproteobacteria bacterium RIFOXYD1_FULL_56_27]